jgi:phosphoribosylamine--glycine ligase
LKVLVLGSGGREHAIAWALRRSPSVREVIVAPGNPGCAAVATCLRPASQSPEDYLALAAQVRPDLTVVGPEAPLVDGVVDLFTAKNFLIFGPTRAAAVLEGSKTFAKRFMERAGIPSARFAAAETPEQARQALAQFSYPLVIKADGLAAGKGVVVCEDRARALQVLEAMFTGALVGAAGRRVVIEEFLAGEEVSFIGLSDGESVLPLEPSQDHKTIYEDGRGPNTGGMGAYSDSRILSPAERDTIMDTVMLPVVAAMKAEGAPFRGFLYAGLMMTADGPKVLEFNVRLGDPETQALMRRLDCDFAQVLAAAARGQAGASLLRCTPEPAVCVVLAAHGYPGTVRTGDPISGLEAAEETGATVFHAATRIGPRGLETAGGRVLGVTHSGPTLEHALENAYRACGKIAFDGLQMRRDIGRGGLKRW